MAQLTVKEKEHWKQRINRKVDQAMDALLATNDAGYKERISTEAHKLALRSLGIEELEGQAAELERQEENSRLQRQQLLRAMIAQITGCRIEDASASYSTQLEIKQAIEKRKLLHEEQLMEKDELGRRILAYRREKEELLDTVWLATSGKQIRQLWTAVAELLQQPPTRLQSEALAIEPESDLS